MKLFKLSTFVAFIISTITATTSFAGREGGGGNAVVCRNANGEITKAELLDLFEGRTTQNLTFDSGASESLSQRTMRAVNKFKESIKGDYQSLPYWFWQDGYPGQVSIPTYLKDFDRYFKILPSDAGLAPLNDSLEVVLPKNCKVERLALFQLGKILIDGEIWEKLNITNRAALIFHEAAYKYERDFYQREDSRNTRRIVATYFADQPVLGLFEDIPQETVRRVATFGKYTKLNGKIVESSPAYWTEYFHYCDSQQNHYVQFVAFLDKQIFSKTLIKFKMPNSHNYVNPEIMASWLPMPSMRVDLNDGKEFIDRSNKRHQHEFDQLTTKHITISFYNNEYWKFSEQSWEGLELKIGNGDPGCLPLGENGDRK